MKKPINRTGHGIIDYTFSALLFSVPFLLKLSPKAKKISIGLGLGATAYSALTDYPVGVKGLFSFKQHRNIDIGSIAATAILPVAFGLAKEKKAAGFFGTMLTIALASVLLTDWED